MLYAYLSLKLILFKKKSKKVTGRLIDYICGPMSLQKLIIPLLGHVTAVFDLDWLRSAGSVWPLWSPSEDVPLCVNRRLTRAQWPQAQCTAALPVMILQQGTTLIITDIC